MYTHAAHLEHLEIRFTRVAYSTASMKPVNRSKMVRRLTHRAKLCSRSRSHGSVFTGRG